MKVIFMGTPDFAVPCLTMLKNEGYEIPFVVTMPDRQRGRGKKVTFSPVKEEAVNLNIPVLQPENVKDGFLFQKVKEANPDVIAVVAYGKILPEDIINYPKYGCVNVHGSLLPKFRGAAPIQRSIMEGESETGITTMLMDKGMDTGDILLEFPVKIEKDDTSGSLFSKLQNLGASALSTTLKKLFEGSITPVKQDEEKATYAPMILKSEALIDFETPAKELINKIRGLNPAPCAYTYYEGKKVKIYKAVLGEETDDKDFGKIIGFIKEKGLKIIGNGNFIYVDEIHVENSKRMAVSEYLKGHKISSGDYFTNE